MSAKKKNKHPATSQVASPSQATTPAPEKENPVPDSTPARRNQKSVFYLSLAVMILAIGVAIAIFFRNQSLNQKLGTLKEDLSASQTNWQEIASEKETLQKELAQVEDNIREANLTYEESTAKIADLSEQVNDLTEQNTSLENQLVVAGNTETAYIRQTGSIENALERMKTAGSALTTELNADNEYTGTLWVTMIEARNVLLSSLRDKLHALNEDLSLAQARLGALAEKGMEAKTDAVRADILDLESQIAVVRGQILKYGTVDDLQ